MTVNDVQRLIDNPLLPNPAEWAMDVEDVLSQNGFLTDDAKLAIKRTNFHNGAFSNYTDTLVAILKRVLCKCANITENSPQGDNVVMTKENVFIVYAHAHADMMREIKEFVREDLGFEPKTLDISECAGSVWEAFAEKSQNCQKAIILMTDDDTVVNAVGREYKQSRPNVFIELGYMIHKCQLRNVTIVYSENCTIPSDLTGLIGVQYKSDKWTEALRKQLNR